MDLFPPEMPREQSTPRADQNRRPPQRTAPAPAAEGQPYAPLAANRARLERLRQKRRRRRLRLLAVLAVAAACALAYFTGLYGASIALLGDIVDSAVIALTPGDGFPVELGLDGVIDIQPLSGGFAAVDSRELVMWSATGRELRRIQHGYASPCITTGNTRVCIYSRGSNSLRIEGRRGTLSEKTLEGEILLAQMSPNGTLAVFTGKGLEVYDPMFDLVWQWNRLDALPLALAFDSGNRKFATALVESRNGALSSTVYLFELGKDSAVGTLEVDDALPVALNYLTDNRLLCVFDTRAVVCDTRTGQQLAVFEYGTRVLQSVSTQSGDNTVFLFADVDTSRHAELIILDAALAPVASAELDARALRVSSDRTNAYVMTSDSVYTFALDGTLCGQALLDRQPLRMFTSGKLYLFTDAEAMEFTPPSRPAEGEAPSVTDLSGDETQSAPASDEDAQEETGDSSQAETSAVPAA